MPQFEWINELVPKLKQGITDKKMTPIMEFDSNQYLKGIEHLGNLYNAIFYKKPLKILYQPYHDENPYELSLHPYYLKQYNNRWFLYGYNPEKEKYDWNLAIDRIVEIVEYKEKFQENNEIDWSEYFDDIIGVTKPVDAQAEKIILHYYGKTGRYIETKPIHGSQKSNWVNQETLEVSLEVIINYELERLILSYADAVKIIKPETLKGRLGSRLEKAIELNNQ